MAPSRPVFLPWNSFCFQISCGSLRAGYWVLPNRALAHMSLITFRRPLVLLFTRQTAKGGSLGGGARIGKCVGGRWAVGSGKQ